MSADDFSTERERQRQRQGERAGCAADKPKRRQLCRQGTERLDVELRLFLWFVVVVVVVAVVSHRTTIIAVC